MSRKVLGRGLGDLLHRARPASAVTRAATPEPQGAHPPVPQQLPLEPSPRPGGTFPPTSSTAGPAPVVPALPEKVERRSPLEPAPPSPTRLPRFGPSYSPPPQPAEPPGRGIVYLVFILDLVLVVFAAAMAFGPWVQRPTSLYLAAAAVLLGGTLACGAVAYQASPHRPPSGSPKPSRVRVRLTRL